MLRLNVMASQIIEYIKMINFSGLQSWVAVTCSSGHSTVQMMKPCQVSEKAATELFTGASFTRYFRNAKNLQWGGNAKGLVKSFESMLSELRFSKRLKGLHLKTTVILSAEATIWKTLGTFLDAHVFLQKLTLCAEHGAGECLPSYFHLAKH